MNKLHNSSLEAHFPEVTQARFFQREMTCTVGFDPEEIQLSVIFTVGKVCILLLEVISGSLNARGRSVSASFSIYERNIYEYKFGLDEKKCNGAEIIMKYSSYKFLVTFNALLEEIGSAKLFVGMAGMK